MWTFMVLNWDEYILITKKW